MELTDIVSAQTLNANQLKAIRDKIVVEKLRLRKAVLSLFPYFDVANLANMQELKNNLISSYPEVSFALKAVNLNSQIKSNESQLTNLMTQNDPNGALTIDVDWKKLPSGSTALEDFKVKANEILNFMLDNQRLKKVKSKKENKIS